MRAPGLLSSWTLSLLLLLLLLFLVVLLVLWLLFFTLASSVAVPSNRRSDAPNYKFACEQCGCTWVLAEARLTLLSCTLDHAPNSPVINVQVTSRPRC